MILAREGVPSPCPHLLSNHYNLTRAEYYRQLDRSSRANSGRGDPLGFLLYSLQGFVDGLREQSRFTAALQRHRLPQEGSPPDRESPEA